MLDLLPAYEEGGAPRAALAQAVVAASEHASSGLSQQWASAVHTQPFQPGFSEPRGGSEESLERLQPAVPEAQESDEATERRPRVLPRPREAGAEDTHRLPSAWLEPPAASDESTDRRPPAWPVPWKASDESTERLPSARLELPPVGDEATERRLPAVPRPVSSAGAPLPASPAATSRSLQGRSRRTAVWLLLGALALGLMGALAVSAW